jgi:hypothetical protein
MIPKPIILFIVGTLQLKFDWLNTLQQITCTADLTGDKIIFFLMAMNLKSVDTATASTAPTLVFKGSHSFSSVS